MPLNKLIDSLTGVCSHCSQKTGLLSAPTRSAATHQAGFMEMNGDSYRLKRSRESAVSQAPDDREEE